MDEDPVERLARREERLRRAQQRIDDDTSTDRARAVWTSRLPALIIRLTVDLARGQLLPPACREALDLLIAYAGDEWRRRPPRVDESNRHVEANIEAQVLARSRRSPTGSTPATSSAAAPDAVSEHDHASARVEVAQGFVDAARARLEPPA